jgi:hypothetical protein
VEDRSTGSSASAAERHTRQFLLQALPLGGIGSLGESSDEREEPLLLGVFGLQASLDQVDEHTIGACFSRALANVRTRLAIPAGIETL